jgi:phosphoribosylaminoimidazolecarboxamide formyltransferase/IMP cyclohydrolase
VPIRRALLSVSDKTGLLDLARGLHALKIELLATGGTAVTLHNAGVPVAEVSEYTEFPEILAGRVKTLHPKIHGGLLGRRGTDDDVMHEHGIQPIDLLVVNLYPFEAAVARPDVTLSEVIENIDIGGPAMLRSAAKNWKDVAVLTSPDQYQSALAEMSRGGELSRASRFRLAVAAFNRVSDYDGAISDYLSSLKLNDAHDAIAGRQVFPGHANGRFVKLLDLRYGENPHQQAALYRDLYPHAGMFATFRQLQGKELSFNNIADADAAWECVRQFDTPACVIVKHSNPCGAALAADALTAYEHAYATDPESAFGGIIAFNHPPGPRTVQTVLNRQFVEVLIAPQVNAETLAAAAAKPNVRVLAIPPGNGHNHYDLKRIGSGLLIQTADNRQLTRAELQVVTRHRPTEQQLDDLLFAWAIAKFVKSNAIVYAKDGRTLGIGAGQTSRVMSARIAALKAADAKLDLQAGVMASDAFFPFRDSVDAAATAAIAAIIQPGGSMRDPEVIAAADEHGIAMVFTGVRHFRH